MDEGEVRKGYLEGQRDFPLLVLALICRGWCYTIRGWQLEMGFEGGSAGKC